MSRTSVERMAKDRSVFAGRLKTLRAEKQMTQAALADASGLPVDTIRQYEYGRREPTYSALLKLAQGLGVSLAAFEAEPPAGESDADNSGEEEPEPRGGKK